jgi:hypothetical protein
MPEIEIICNPDGTVEIEGIEFDGQGCHEAISKYVKALGIELSAKKKAEFYRAKQKQSQKGSRK